MLAQGQGMVWKRRSRLGRRSRQGVRPVKVRHRFTREVEVGAGAVGGCRESRGCRGAQHERSVCSITTSSIHRRRTHDDGSSGSGSPNALCHFTFRPTSTILLPHAFVPIPPQNGPPSHPDMTLLAYVCSLEHVVLQTSEIHEVLLPTDCAPSPRTPPPISPVTTAIYKHLATHITDRSEYESH